MNDCFSEGICEHRALKYLSAFEIGSKSIFIDFNKTTEADIRAYFGSIDISLLSDWTKHDYKDSRTNNVKTLSLKGNVLIFL